ncbi:MAG TPA: CTP synthase [Rectinema sp.]|jgi:CTP synthase|nr:CTP synthase [Spirochaetota bacterium]HOO01745.1 CTP synthase [Rectinema sp.]HOU60526.1 CTP synthase [Rectinema sp.]HPD69532.1 CTP synthase [Rectinema sp.]HRS31803.1 CTP synthase [Rectinema sp.]
MRKLLFVTGGVCSSLGKGIAASSIGALMEARGFNVQMVKIDPYLNVDAGTMSPYQHGEVYVTDDGAETDLDLGNYGRFTTAKLSRSNSITTGQVYKKVIEKERAGDYLGRTVQVVPHITDEIKERILAVASNPDVDMTIVEIGGTVGDIESVPFLEACRQLIHELGKQNAISIHVTLVPAVSSGEIKTKPTQHAVKELQEIGIQPDALILRSSKPLSDELRRKISLFTNVEEEGVISGYDATTIYEVPLIYYSQRLDTFLLRKMNVESRHAELNKWQTVVQAITKPNRKVKIAVVGKYMDLQDAYKSIWEALIHGGIAYHAGIDIERIDSSRLEDPRADLDAIFKDIHGILIPGGFGERGIEGMICAARYAREKNIPYFGICLGMQIMVIEYARSILGWQDAHSTEFNKSTQHPVVCLLEEQKKMKNYGGTMRLGAYDAVTKVGSNIRAAYGVELISERHRHRYEVNSDIRLELEAHDLRISATTVDGELIEACEWPNHPWSVGVQFHPEFKSRPTAPHPLFREFIGAALSLSRL